MRAVLFYLSAGIKLLLREYWGPVFPCPNVRWTCEHVVPRSLIAEHNDLHNLILLPDRLNHARSNYPYIQNSTDNNHKSIPPCSQPDCQCEGRGVLVSKHLFIPPDRFKGQIARAVLCMDQKYPHRHDVIHNRVLDLGLAHDWDLQFPATAKEIEWDKLILSLQGDSNPFVHQR